jgi:hypothetical protein
LHTLAHSIGNFFFSPHIVFSYCIYILYSHIVSTYIFQLATFFSVRILYLHIVSTYCILTLYLHTYFNCHFFQTDFEGVNEAVMDKAYMGHLVSVQHQVCTVIIRNFVLRRNVGCCIELNRQIQYCAIFIRTRFTYPADLEKLNQQ